MPPLVLGSLLFAALLLLSAALGLRLLRLLRINPSHPGHLAVFAVGLGLGALPFLAFILLAVGYAHPIVLRTALLLLACLLLPDIKRVVTGAVRLLRRRWELSAWERLLLGIFALLLGTVYLRALCPITDDDGLSYHLAAALRLLDAGRFVYLPTLTYTNWPLGTESLFLLLRACHPDAPAGPVQFAFGTLTVATTYLFARQIGGRTVAAGAAVLMLAYKVFWEEMAQAHVDLGTAVFAALAVFAMHMARDESKGMRDEEHLNAQRPTPNAFKLIPHPSSLIPLSALFAGLAATSKLNGVWVIVSLTLILLTTVRGESEEAETDRGYNRGTRWKAALRLSAGYMLIAVCVALPWFLRTWVVTGNPLYPMFYGLLGGREWTAEGWPRIQRYFLLMNTPPGLPPTHANLILGRIALVGAATALAAYVYWRTRRSSLAVPARFAVTFPALIFLGSGYNMRFLLAAYPCVALCAAYGLFGRWERSDGVPAKGYGIAALCTLALFLAFRIGVRGLEPDLATALRVTAGRTPQSVYLRAVLDDYAVVEYANRKLPREACLLVGTWEENTAYYHPLALRANYWLQDSIHYDTPERLENDLRRLGVTYLVLKPMEREWCERSSVCKGRMDTETRALFDLAHRRGKKLFEANGVALFHLTD